MAQKSFHLNTEPHIAIIGEYKFLFQPETNGAKFATAYEGLKEAQSVVAAAKGDDVTAEGLRSVSTAMRTFLATFLMPESAALFSSVDLPDRVLTELIEFLAEVYGGGTAGNGDGGSSSAS